MPRLSKVALLLVVMLALSVGALAETPTPNPEMQKWEPLIGKWVGEEEQRTKPDGPWEKVSSEWEIRWMTGKFFVETFGRMRWLDGRDNSWIEVFGYDASRKMHFTTYFTNRGVVGTMTVLWTGTRRSGRASKWRRTARRRSFRCTWVYSSDHRSVEGTCEPLTDGKWWVLRKVKARSSNCTR
jgi:hypothetical protein